MNDDEEPQINGVEALLAEVLPTLDPRRMREHLFPKGPQDEDAPGEGENDD